ncbi:hypothetical protein scyTo_0005369, partial [Scyliorhinus torazame]|nr:hypothetical protein [Scyliorhinus torazame]
NLNIATILPELHFTTLVRSINGTYLYVDVTMNGQEVIRATLYGVVGESLLIPITNHQEVMIYEPIILKPKTLVFPWHPKPRSYRHPIQVIGGSGNFTWSSCNESVALVTVKGVIATGDNRGFSIIQAWDVENPIHFGKMRVNVLRPVSIEFVRSRVEIEVGQTLDLPIMVYGLLDSDDMETVPVNDCSLMNLAVEMDKQGVFKVIQGHRMVIVYKRKGTVSITVYLVGYRKTNIAIAKSPVGVFLPITATIDLLLVDDVSLVPRNLTVYNHPDILEIVYLTEGSGYFFVNTTDTEILTSTYLETKNYVQIRPLQPGIVTMKAYDLCLTCKGPARAEIYVSDIFDFELDFIHKVFPPFRLIPRKVTLIIGGMMQVMSEGGPQPQSNIYFSINNHTIAKVNELGQLTALVVGTAKVIGIVQAVDDDTGRVVVFSQISLQLSAEHNFAMLLYSKAEGKTGLKVTIKAQNPSAGQFERYVDRFSDEIQIMVFGILQLLPLSLPAEEVLMSPNSYLKLQTSRDGKAYVNYEVRKCPHNKSVIMEDGHGVLTSGSRTGSSALTVTSLEYFGLNQTIVTGVRVAPVAYLSINTSPKLYIAKNEELAALPLGMTLTFTVNFYDLSGDQFHAHNTKLYLALNR